MEERDREKGTAHTCLNSSRVNTRRGRGGGRSGTEASRTAELVTETTDAASVVVIGASTSGSVMFVSWEVLMMVELSNSELASGETDRRVAAGCNVDGESYTRGNGSATREQGFHTLGEVTWSIGCVAKHVHTSASSTSSRKLAPSAVDAPAGALWLSEHNFLTAGSSRPLSTASRGRFLGEPLREDGGEGVA